MSRCVSSILAALALGMLLATGLRDPSGSQAPVAPREQAPAAPAAPAPAAGAPAPGAKPAGPTETRFEAIDIFVDSGEKPLSAYQFELTTPVRDGWQASIVGVEGGEHPAFKAAPYYDPQALRASRIIIAAFSIDEALPTGRTRVARLHMELRRDGSGPRSTAAEAGRPASPASGAAPAGTGGLSPDERALQAKSNVAITRREGARQPLGGYAVSLVTAASREGTATSAAIAIEAAPPTVPEKSPGGTP